MIFGCYPCCNGDLCLGVPDVTPKFQKEACPHCGAVVWHKLSRIDAKSWVESDFLEIYKVDENDHTLSLVKEPNPELLAHIDEVMAPYLKERVEEIANHLIYGDGGPASGGLLSALGNSRNFRR